MLAPFLIADIVNPVLFAFMVYAVGTGRPLANSGAMLLGHTLAYFSVGLVLASGFERLAEPRTVDFVIELIIGVLLLWVALRYRRKTSERVEVGGRLTPLKAFGLGAVINFVGAPFALPYFAALDQILKADLSTLAALVVLLGYNFLYALPFMMVPVLAAVRGEQSRRYLLALSQRLDRLSAYLTPVLFTLVGLALIGDAGSFFLRGKALF